MVGVQNFMKLGQYSNNMEQQLALDDRAIRRVLLQKLAAHSPKAIIEELYVHRGNAIADVVAIHSEAHCYEIKGEGDNIQRIVTQGKYYDLVFPKVTLVTTFNHLEKALKLVPDHWGIMLARRTENGLKIGYIRSAKRNRLFDKQLALLTLWRSELAEVAIPLTDKKTAKLSRASLTEIIAENLSPDTLMKNIGEKLIARAAAKMDSRDSCMLCAC